MTDEQIHLCERLKRLGFAREKQMKLYGEQFDLVSDPVVVNDQVVFVDAVEKKSGTVRRVLVPLPVVKMASVA